MHVAEIRSDGTLLVDQVTIHASIPETAFLSDHCMTCVERCTLGLRAWCGKSALKSMHEVSQVALLS